MISEDEHGVRPEVTGDRGIGFGRRLDHSEVGPVETARIRLADRNEMHYDSFVFEHVDWTYGAEHMQSRHGLTPDIADEALGDPDRVVIVPDYNSTSGRSVRIIGYSTLVGKIVTVILVEDGGIEYGVNGWESNSKDRRIYGAGSYHEQEGEANGQEDREDDRG